MVRAIHLTPWLAAHFFHAMIDQSRWLEYRKLTRPICPPIIGHALEEIVNIHRNHHGLFSVIWMNAHNIDLTHAVFLKEPSWIDAANQLLLESLNTILHGA